MKSLADKFVVRTFRFSSAARRLGNPQELTFAGSQTRLGMALEGARQELAGLPLAGLVMVTDGADTTDASLSDALLAPEGGQRPGLHGRRRRRVAAQGHSDRPDLRAARRAEGHVDPGRRGGDAARLCRRDGHARRRRRRPHRRLAGSAAAGRRRARRGARAIHRVGSRSAGLPVQGGAAVPARW